MPHVECDALFWEAGWRKAERETFLARVAAATSGNEWVVDGNYGSAGARDIVWSRADTVIWLDFSLRVTLARLTRRNLSRIRSGAEIWPGTGNRETIRNTFFSLDSLYVWALKTYRRRRREYPALLARPEYAHLVVLHFTSPRDADRWLEAQRAATPARI